MSLNHNQLFEAHVESAKQLTAGRLNNMIHVQGANAIRPGVGCRISQTPGGTTVSAVKRRVKPVHAPPFDVELITVSNSLFYVTVSGGYVCERDIKLGAGVDAIINHKPSNMIDEDGKPKRFPIASGQSVYVKVLEGASGSVGGSEPVTIVVDTTGKTSTNFIPGYQAGEYYYELAKLTVADGTTKLELVLSGSHIYRESGLTCDLVIDDCTDTMIYRMSFVSGSIVSMNEALEARALADVYTRKRLKLCEPPCYVP